MVNIIVRKRPDEVNLQKFYKILLQKETVVEKSAIYQTRKTGVERYKFEYTVGQLHNFTVFSAEKCSQIVYTVTSLLLCQF